MISTGTGQEPISPSKEKRPLKNERWIGGTDEEGMQSFQDRDEGDTGVVSDTAYNREGASRVLRSELGDQSMEHPVTPVPRASDTTSDRNAIANMSRDDLRKRAAVLGIPGRSKMTKAQLSQAFQDASKA